LPSAGRAVTIAAPGSGAARHARKEDVMTTPKLLSLVVGGALVLAVATAGAQAPPPPPPYGPPITLEQAKKVMAAAEAEATKNKWDMVIVILDSGGHGVMMTRMDNAQFGSIGVARDKAHSAVAFRRPTKVFQDLLGKGGDNLRLLNLRGASMLEGGIPIVVNGKLIGAAGCSGGTSPQDAQVCQAGIDALK
jgi:glc operon protein GlcG